jgi:hypothetical protein
MNQSDESAPAAPPASIVTRAIAPVTAEQIDRAFTYHAPKGDQPRRYEGLRASGKALAKQIVTSSPPGREQSLALTNLEQAIMWANAAIARGE